MVLASEGYKKQHFKTRNFNYTLIDKFIVGFFSRHVKYLFHFQLFSSIHSNHITCKLLESSR